MTKYDSIIYYYNFEFGHYYCMDFDFDCLRHCMVDRPRGKRKRRLNELFIMLDTETSKSEEDHYTTDKHGKKQYAENINYIVKWSIGINIWGFNLGVIWGNTPWELCECIQQIHGHLNGNATIFYCHNWSYDNIFLRKFLFKQFGFPMNQLSTKPHYPVCTEFENGVQIRDSLILAQRSLERWGADMHVQHAKAIGKWDYNRIRHQQDTMTDDEMLYICNDVLCGVECLDALRRANRKTYAGIPYTATGFVRNEARVRGGNLFAHKRARQCYSTYDNYLMCESVYHGGYTHANRNFLSHVIDEETIYCFDFASKYPACMLMYKFPCEAFTEDDASMDEILKYSDTDAYIFTFKATGVKLKNYWFGMPVIQTSKCNYIVDGISDNGRILEAAFVEINITDVDLKMYLQYYDFAEIQITNVLRAAKEYIPRWLSDYVYELFKAKTQLKGVDDVLYAIAKAHLNSIYG
ncbi:MAG: hypothetical protein IKV85_06855 [Ruminococcus sp.]|nr:hypothetical protein [Ruminococcus sp.]